MATFDKVVRFPIHLANWFLLGLALIAPPHIASGRLFGLQVLDAQSAQVLALAGLALALAANVVGAAMLFRRKAKSRRLCLQWSAIDAMFLCVFWLVLRGVIHFEWLRDWCVRIQERLGL